MHNKGLIFSPNPIWQRRKRRHDKIRPRSPLLNKVREKRDDLDSFSEAHLVCEDSGDTVLVEGGEPADSFELVVF